MRQWKSPASDNIPLELIQSGGLPSKTELILGNADDCHDALWPKHSDLKYTQKTTINMHCKILYIFDLILYKYNLVKKYNVHISFSVTKLFTAIKI